MPGHGQQQDDGKKMDIPICSKHRFTSSRISPLLGTQGFGARIVWDGRTGRLLVLELVITYLYFQIIASVVWPHVFQWNLTHLFGGPFLLS